MPVETEKLESSHGKAPTENSGEKTWWKKSEKKNSASKRPVRTGCLKRPLDKILWQGPGNVFISMLFVDVLFSYTRSLF